MRLKRLTIKGFKSFADETVIHFNENLIGIVGPNGSGKSNVVDSIRWVLGEQKTKELRLDSMADVIFNGTKNRKEGKIAKVTLSFDNTKNVLPTEYNEVSISRILYRNGTSEYQLNNVPCRKRDITNLFIDSGIGSNSYAIISLNMVEDILHDNGGSRRSMIEQASGIAKYKQRKKETLRKLRGTLEDLDRVQDLLFEIEKNMASFERQAKRTEKYNQLKVDYKDLSIKISHIEVREFSLKYDQLKKQIEVEKDARIKINTQLTQDEAELQKLKAAIIDYEKSLSQDQQAFNSLIEDLGKVESDKNLCLQKLQSARDRLAEIEQSSKQLDQSVGSTQSKYESAIKAKEGAQQQLSTAEAVYQDADQSFGLQSTAFEELRQREKEIKSAVTANQILKENLGREIEALLTRQSILSSDITSMSERKAAIAESVSEDRKVLEQQLEEIGQLETGLEDQVQKVAKLEEDLEEEQVKTSEATVNLNQKRAEQGGVEQRIKFLKNIIESNEGLPESAKYILKKGGVQFQVLADVIEVTDEAYANIIELFLEPYFYHIISKSRKEAIGLYEQVRDAQKGKINVLISDQYKSDGKSVPRADLMPLDTLIKTDKKYRPIINHICSSVYVSDHSYKDLNLDDLDDDITVLFPKEYLIYRGGHIYGGSNTLFEGIQLGRKKVLEDLQTKEESIKSEVKDLEGRVDASKKSQDEHQGKLLNSRKQVEQIRASLEEQREKLYQVQSKMTHVDESIKELELQVSAKTEEVAGVESDLTIKNAAYGEIQHVKIDEMSDQELALKIEEGHKLYLSASSSREEAQSSLFEAKSTFNIASNDVEFHKNTLGSIAERIDELRADKNTQEEIISSSEKQLEDIKVELEKKYTDKADVQKKLSAYEDTYYKEKGKIFELEKSITESRSKLYAKDQLVANLSEQFTKVEFEIKSINERNSIEFGIEIKLSEFPPEYEDEDLEALKNKKNRIQERIRNFGDINPMAITAYNEIKERHDQISKERDDILEAKVSLEETITEIEAAASERFNASLDEIRVNFKKVFQGLFSKDDDCDIVLLDNEDPLEAKIEIIAKPKGKRPKSINSLSGGEKTLTAASFLFALYLLKPAPFCIFDEVDAPLDDVNVLKFNKIIRNFSKDSQFIVITHNKLTMSEVDILYGVYLKELGVSGVSAVDFRTYDQTEMTVTN